MDIYTLDFETYYDQQYSLSKLTTEEYVRDERFEVVGLAIKKEQRCYPMARLSEQDQTSTNTHRLL